MGKHEYGSGTVYQRGTVWWFSYWTKGRKIQKSSRSHDEAEARRQLKVAIGEAAAGGGDVIREKATIDDLFALVKADYEVRNLRDLPAVEWRYKAHIKKTLGPLLASRFSPNTARAHVAKRRKEGAENATINRELSIIRRGFSLALREDPPLARRAPYILKLEEDNARQGFVEEAQYLTIRAAMPEHLKALFVVAYHTGMRLGELRKLRWDQVDLEAGEIRIERRQAKGKKARALPIYGDMMAYLEAQPRAGDLVFTWKGKPIGSHVKGWQKACAAAGLEWLKPHDLRRSAIRNMELAGVSRGVAMAYSGHSTESVYKRYAIVSQGDMKEAVGKLNRYKKPLQSVKVINDK